MDTYQMPAGKMKEDLLEKGWSKDSHLLPGDSMNSLIKNKNEYLQLACTEVQKEFNITFTSFEIEKLEFIELAKAITRSLLRYDADSILIVNSVFKRLLNTYKFSSEIQYCTLPYPIIHFPNYDISEKGAIHNRHKDGIDGIKYLYTTWTPLNDCFHKPMAITENTHKKRNPLAEKLCSRFKFIDNFLVSLKNVVTPDLKIGEYLIWNGQTDHEGLFNMTNQAHIALVIRFTSSPIMYEGSLPTSDLENHVINDSKTDTLKTIQLFIRFFKEIKQHAALHEKEQFSLEVLNNTIDFNIKKWGLQSYELKKLSFMLTLFAQRMEKRDGRDKVILYYMYSFNCALDNIWGLYRTLQYVIDHYDNAVINSFIDKIMLKYPYIQTHEMVKQAKASSKNTETINSTNLKLNLLKW